MLDEKLPGFHFTAPHSYDNPNRATKILLPIIEIYAVFVEYTSSYAFGVEEGIFAARRSLRRRAFNSTIGKGRNILLWEEEPFEGARAFGGTIVC